MAVFYQSFKTYAKTLLPNILYKTKHLTNLLQITKLAFRQIQKDLSVPQNEPSESAKRAFHKNRKGSVAPRNAKFHITNNKFQHHNMIYSHTDKGFPCAEAD